MVVGFAGDTDTHALACMQVDPHGSTPLHLAAENNAARAPSLSGLGPWAQGNVFAWAFGVFMLMGFR